MAVKFPTLSQQFATVYLAHKYLHMKTFLIALLLSAPFVTVVAQTATLTKAERKAAAK
jgi:hypothetical protein